MKHAAFPYILALIAGVSLCSPARAAAPGPAEKFRLETLKPSVQGGLQDADVAAFADKLTTAKQEPDSGWPADDELLSKIQDFSSKFSTAKQAFNKGQGEAPKPEELDALSGQIREIIVAAGIADKDKTLETAYMAQLAPLAAVNAKVAQDMQARMKALESKLPPGKRPQYQAAISKFQDAAKAGDWKEASAQFQSLYDNMKGDGGADTAEARGQANVIARALRPRPADNARQFTSNKSQFEGGLKINNNVPIPYTPEEVRKVKTAETGKTLGVVTMAAGGGVLAWTGAAALGIVAAPTAGVVLVGGALVVLGFAAYSLMAGMSKGKKEAPASEDSGDSDS